MANHEDENPSDERSAASRTAGTRLRQAGWRVVGRVAPTASHLVAEVPQLRDRARRNDAELQALRAEIQDLRARLDRVRSLPGQVEQVHRAQQALREDVQEARRLHQRVAELTDVVAELLVSAADVQDTRMQGALSEFASTSF